MTKPKDFLLRDIPPELHRQIKVRAAEEGLTMRDWILRALEKNIEEGRGK